jgi:putative tryptophan/tyrosine transport system substrate-binding protein
LSIGGGPLLTTQQERLAALATRHAVPAVGEYREFVASGGLASYGSSLTDSYRLTGVYAARILKGEKPGDAYPRQGTQAAWRLDCRVEMVSPASRLVIW